MADWADGYVADLDYTFGYYPELNPNRVKLAFLNQGYAPLKFKQACELGFGQSLSINIHAAGSVTQWLGTDINPSQTLFARELARASGPILVYLTKHLRILKLAKTFLISIILVFMGYGAGSRTKTVN